MLSSNNTDKTMQKRTKHWTRSEVAGWTLIILGAALRLRQYLADRSLWHDEANLALNLVNRSFAGLTQPLDYEQGAPIGFLFIEKFFLIILGNKDYILRLFPLITGLLSLYMIYRITKEYFGTAGLFAVGALAISYPLIYYSSELKQYSSDVLFALLLIYLSLRCLKENAPFQNFLLLGIAGFISIWISHPSAFVLAGIGITLFFAKTTQKKTPPLFWTIGLGAAWTASFGTEYLVSLRYLAADSFLQNYWRPAFLPLPIWDHLDWLSKTYATLLNISANPSTWYQMVLYSILALIGAFGLFKRDRHIAMILLLPFPIALIASALQKYPLRERFMLFLIPEFILLTAEGLKQIFTAFKKLTKNLTWAVALSAVIILLGTSATISFENFLTPNLGEDIKPVLQYIEENKAPGDIVYVYHGARPSFVYYAESYGLTAVIPITVADFNGKTTPKDFQRDLNLLPANSRVWFIFSHLDDCNGCPENAEAFLVSYVNQIGSEQDSFHAAGADVYLYSLKP
jgi:hypothetical protein